MNNSKDTADHKIKVISEHFAKIMEALNLDLSDPSLKDTPLRYAKMMVNELSALTTGVLEMPKMAVFPNDKEYNQMVVVSDITFASICEHHFVPFYGSAYIAYLPKDNILGLSKFARTVQLFSAKPQVQERLTQEVAMHLTETLHTEDVAVIMKAKHLCCSIRGAKDPNSYTTTSYVGGVFLEDAVKQEFLHLAGLK